jgi:RHS repeat-associated protein
VSATVLRSWRSPGVVLGLLLAMAAPVRAQTCGGCPFAELPAFLCPLTAPVESTDGCAGCQQPTIKSTRIDIVPQGDGTFQARLVARVEAPSNPTQPQVEARLQLYWNAGGTATHPTTSLCQHATTASAETFLVYPGLTCDGAPYDLGTYSLRAIVCLGAGCQRIADASGLSFQVSKQALGCPEPPAWGCDGDGGCTYCLTAGGGAGSPAGEGGSAEPAESGPGARLRYRAGGVGNPVWPGAAAWNVILGRYWSHDYAERIVADPGAGHVWLLTRFATFREFTDANADGVYEKVSPSDEKRRLTKTATGWELKELDGTVHAFGAAGLWLSTADRHGNSKTATYTGGVLTRVDFPDGRLEDFTYLGGKLRTITEVGVGGTTSRTWTYTWTGNDLTRIDRPDGTAWDFFYSSDPNLGGYLTRMDLRGTTPGSGRVDTAWEYDAQGNVLRLWRGDPSFTGPNAIEKWSFSYDNPARPARTEVTDPLGRVSVYSIGRDTASRKPRIEKLEGDCPSCGSGPNSTYSYQNAANPLLPTVVVDGRGLRTEFTYNADGQVTRKLEGVSTPLLRDTNWQYHPTWPALVTAMDVPSTSGGAARRETLTTWDAQGNPAVRTIQGAESGGAFSHATASSFNAGGQPLTVDPPGHGTADAITFTYDATRGNGRLVLQTRTDPLIGATTYTHDAYNRRTGVTDPNGVQTVTAYDALDRVTSITQQGGGGTPDLITTHTYNEFGDLFRTTLPEGNVIEYGYDAAGRLISIERKPNATTPGERTLYTLDTAGHRIREELQRWTGGVWVSASWTDFVYSTRCHLDKVIRPDGTATGAVTEYAYDCSGNLERVWDPNHPSNSKTAPATQVYAYDQLDRLAALTQPWTGSGGGNAVTTYAYDVQNHLTSVTDAEGNVTTYVYSDRDLMTQQVSPVSGQSTSTYNEHGELVTEIDARGVVVTRTLDVLDRVTAVTYPDATLNVTYTYDTGPFGKGRLAGIARHGETVSSTYDRLGRLLQDGVLTYEYDKNGNQTKIIHPDSVTATYDHDFADREETLTVQVGANPPLQLVNDATYEPFGPLSTLVLGNGLTETRSFDDRNAPSGIQVNGTGTILNWSYTTDPVGNITGIADVLNPANNRTYAYQDVHYFLTQGNGPWGPRSWTYDRIGNRLSETRGAVTDTYTYPLNPAGGRNPKLRSITQGAGGTRFFGYDAAGNNSVTYDNKNRLDLIYNSASRLSVMRSVSEDARTYMHYDGRGYLRQAAAGLEECRPGVTIPTYDSEGLLRRRAHLSLFAPAAPPSETDTVFYFAGRPVATLRLSSGSSTLTYLTTDHLGTPILAVADTGALVWQGGFEPFGANWNGASAAGVFLRFPGQWADREWESSRLESGLYYNLHRWYGSGVGRYGTTDPLGLAVSVNLYTYAYSNPVLWTDSDGRLPVPPPFTAQCVYSVAKEARELGRSLGWPWAHCWASCRISKECGNPGVALVAGFGKEVSDLIQCGMELFGTGADATGFGDHCKSAFQESDFRDNRRGIDCPPNKTCDSQCGPLLKTDSMPGPLWGSGYALRSLLN